MTIFYEPCPQCGSKAWDAGGWAGDGSNGTFIRCRCCGYEETSCRADGTKLSTNGMSPPTGGGGGSAVAVAKPRTHDLAWLKRVDLADGQSELLDAFGNRVAIVQTERLAGLCDNLAVARYKLTVTPMDDVPPR